MTKSMPHLPFTCSAREEGLVGRFCHSTTMLPTPSGFTFLRQWDKILINILMRDLDGTTVAEPEKAQE